jgi:hypothetical protein
VLYCFAFNFLVQWYQKIEKEDTMIMSLYKYRSIPLWLHGAMHRNKIETRGHLH